MLEDFRASLIGYAERVQRVREHIRNEEATKVSLILPFLALLGYDDRDPTEVSAEHAADFSEKYKNRVDYAVLKDMKPVIAVECKSVGNGKKDDRGQLKAYFNACRTVKLGILTDGIVYEFFVDSQEQNMMDDEPFLTIDFDLVAKGQLIDNAVEGLNALTKSKFDPEMVSENARRSITHRAFFEYLSNQFNDPSMDFTRFLLKENDIKHVRQNAMDGYRAIAKSALDDVFTTNVLKRLDISGSLPKPLRPDPVLAPPISLDVSHSLQERGVVTTDTELRAYEDIRRRLAFLVSGRADLFDAIQKVHFKDYQGKMVVFYNQERKGRLIDILENRDGQLRFVVADGGDPSPIESLPSLDSRLKALFEKRVAEV